MDHTISSTSTSVPSGSSSRVMFPQPQTERSIRESPSIPIRSRSSTNTASSFSFSIFDPLVRTPLEFRRWKLKRLKSEYELCMKLVMGIKESFSTRRAGTLPRGMLQNVIELTSVENQANEIAEQIMELEGRQYNEEVAAEQ